MNKCQKIILLLASLTFSLASLAGNARHDIHNSAADVQPLLPGMDAPGFTVNDVRGKPFEFDPLVMTKPVVLTFYRGGWCPYCNLHLSEMRLVEKQLKEKGFDIWFISIDKPEMLLESLDDPKIGYTIFSDATLNATRAFGLAFRVDDETNERYLAHGIDLEKASGQSHHVLPAPATYIISEDGTINFAYINPTYTVRLHPNVLMAAANAYMQQADKRLLEMRKK